MAAVPPLGYVTETQSASGGIDHGLKVDFRIPGSYGAYNGVPDLGTSHALLPYW